MKKQIQNYKDFGNHDLVFDLTATTRSFMLCFLNKAKLRIGFIHRNIHKLLYDVAVYRSVFKYEGETFLDQLAVLGFDYQWPLNYGLPKHEAVYKDPYIVIFPTASTPTRCWPTEYFIELINKMTGSIKSHKIVLLTGISDWEKNIANDIMQGIIDPSSVTLLEGVKQTENSVADKEEACVANADLIICNDTGIRNMAIAYHTPTVGLFMASLPFRYYPRFDKHIAVFDVSGEAPSVDNAFSAVDKIINSD